MSKQYSAEFKSRVAMAALKEEKPTAELSKEYQVPTGVINRWRREAIEALTFCFKSKNGCELSEAQEKISILEQKVGQLTMDNDFLKKNFAKYCQK